MAVRERRQRPAPQTEEELSGDVVVDPEVQARNDKLKAEMDDLLDDIEHVLDENAEEFVRSYVQKGGQ